MNENRVFYVVRCLNDSMLRQATEGEACAEAKRQARRDPSQHFYVLKAISRFESIDRPVAETTLFEPHEPMPNAVPSEAWLKERGL